ncbi:MAG: pyridoxal phosphate-dependent aminotransferase [Clostridia bacterium]|nr:pyridoxal phosphate-dependent aminotransferase [Clostridia bacterium]
MKNKNSEFDRLTDRRGTYSYKWAVAEGELPMWVADMDFETAPAIRAALMKRAAHGIFGYSELPKEYFTALADYRQRRDGYRPDPAEMVYSNGVVAAISSMVRSLTAPGESVLIEAPVYNIFYNSILNNGRRVLSSDLVYENGGYRVDFSDLEEKLARPETTLMLLCNPHNPVGRVWKSEELAMIGELCKRHGVTVVSDEIHCDIIRPGVHFTPFAAASETCKEISVSCLSASKTFNIAGLQSAALVISDPALRYRVWRALNNDEVGEPNCFSMTACIAAYTECDEWVAGLVDYLFENRAVAEEYIARRLPMLRTVRADATYLCWIDISEIESDSVRFTERVRAATGLYLSDGAEYGECGRSFVRMNLATQRERLFDGLDRLYRAVLEIYGGPEAK